MSTTAERSLASCPGAQARIRPWEPHVECRPCIRRQFVGVTVIQPAIKSTDLVCPNQVTA